MDRTLILYGFKSLEKRDLKKAHEIFNEIMIKTKDKKERFDAMIGLSITLNDLGDLDNAIIMGKKAIDLDIEPWISYFNLGNFYESRGDHALAIQGYDLAISANSNYPDAYINRGVAWYYLDKLDQAKRDFKNCLDLDPNSSRALSNLGVVTLKEGKPEKAIDLFDRALEKDSENIFSLCGKGIALYYFDQYDESMICFDASLSIQPDFYIASYFKGHILKKLDLLDDAEESILESISSRKKFSIAWFELGEIYRLKGDDEKALGSYEKAIEYHGRSYEEALYKKGNILQKRGDMKGAVHCYKIICKNNPHIPKVWVDLGIALSKMGDSEMVKAISSFNNALYLEPGNPNTVFHLAELLLEKGEYSKALSILIDGLEKYPDTRNSLLLAKIYFVLKRYGDAINAADDAISMDSNNSDAWLVMGRSYKKIGKEEEYKQCLRKYLNIRPEDKKIIEELKRISRS